MQIHKMQAPQKHAMTHVQSAHLAAKAAGNVAKADASAAAKEANDAMKVDVQMLPARTPATWAMRKLKCHSTQMHLQMAFLKLSKATRNVKMALKARQRKGSVAHAIDMVAIGESAT
jgi:hypothetical protein